MQGGRFDNLACANERYVMFGYNISVENRMSVWLSKLSVGSVVGGKKWQAAVCDNKFNRVKHI